MDEAALIDWYDVVEATANGRLTGHVCPLCGGAVEATSDGAWVRVRCAACGQGFEGRMGYGRDDAFQAEAGRLTSRRSAAVVAEAPAAAVQEAASPATPEPRPARVRRSEPWAWQLPASGAGDVEGLSVWMDVVQSVHNGRQTGLRCPFCSEPLGDITAEPPYMRIRCQHCHEGFEGRVG